MNKLDLDYEVTRLLKAMKEPKIYPWLMSREEKIGILARGVIKGWYGNHEVRSKILKDLYSEVQGEVNRQLKS